MWNILVCTHAIRRRWYWRRHDAGMVVVAMFKRTLCKVAMPIGTLYNEYPEQNVPKTKLATDHWYVSIWRCICTTLYELTLPQLLQHILEVLETRGKCIMYLQNSLYANQRFERNTCVSVDVNGWVGVDIPRTGWFWYRVLSGVPCAIPTGSRWRVLPVLQGFACTDEHRGRTDAAHEWYWRSAVH